MDTTSSHLTPFRHRPAAAANRLAGTVLTAITLLLALAAVATGVLVVSGHSLATERSGSMTPLLHPGDVLISTPILASQVRVGDVITFADPNVAGVRLTHRVRSEHPLPGGRLAFVTRGDANTGSEHWTVAADGRLTRLVSHVPAVGWPLIGIESHPLYAAILIGAVLWFALLGLMWGRVARGEEDPGRHPARPRPWRRLGGRSLRRSSLGVGALMAAGNRGRARIGRRPP